MKTSTTQRNKFVSYRNKSIKKDISKGAVKNNFFWSIIKPFLTNKGYINGVEITLKTDNETITYSSVLTEMFHSDYINIVAKTSGKKSNHFARQNKISDTTEAINLIFQSYLNHSSVNLRLLSKIKSPQLHHLKLSAGQVHKKYNF